MPPAVRERPSWTAASRPIFAALIFSLVATCANAQEADQEQLLDSGSARLALVIGQSDYRGAHLITGTEDASRMSEALQSAGFSVDGGADLEQQLIREKVRALVEKAIQGGGAETILVYLGGRVAQLNGENLLLPVGAPLERATDVVLNGFRLNDLVNALKFVPAKARIIMIDAAAPPEQLAHDKAFSPGLAMLNAPEGFLIAFNQNPGRPLLEPQPPMGSFCVLSWMRFNSLSRPTETFSLLPVSASSKKAKTARCLGKTTSSPKKASRSFRRRLERPCLASPTRTEPR